MEIILSTIIFPQEKEKESLYFRGECDYQKTGHFAIEQGKVLSLNTYFNSFSYDNYVNYTNIDKITFQVKVQGTGIVSLLCQSDTEKNKLEEAETIQDETTLRFSVDIRTLPPHGLLFLELQGTSSTLVFLEGVICTEVEERTPVSLAMVICTYRREEYVKSNLDKLRADLFQRQSPPIHVFVIDNGSSFQYPCEEWLSIVENRNLGGSGGFTRGMVEALKGDYTHVLLMDDDISFEVESILRVISFLSLEREEDKPCIFGGHMLLEEQPTIQFEAGGRYENGRLMALHQNIDVSQEWALLENQIQEPQPQYQAWWFCCMPLKVIEQVGLPLPFFIKTDDVEYGMRCACPVLLMNGVGVWHASFESKQSPHLEYYIKRNELIVSSLYGEGDGLLASIVKFSRASLKSVLWGNPSNFQFIVLAYRDFLKGSSRFLEEDAEKKHKELLDRKSKRLEQNRLFSLIRFPFVFTSVILSLLVSYTSARKDYMKNRESLTSLSFWEKQFFPPV